LREEHAARTRNIPADNAGVAKKGRLYERNQYVCGFAYSAVRYPAAAQESRPETTDRRRVRNAKDVSVLRIDHISIEGTLYGVRRVPYGCGVFNDTEMTHSSFFMIP
jgi:hypothetical protein